jgi:HlyD family secretion protein
MMSLLHSLRLSILLMALLPGLAACGNAEPEARRALPAPTVSVARVTKQSLTGGLTASGRLLPREEVAVASELSGYRVASVLVEENDLVRRGQLLAMLDDTLLRSQVAQAQAALAQQQVASERSRDEAERVRGLDSQGVISDEAIQQRRLSARSAEAAVAVARAQLNDLLVRRARLAIRAPSDGRILERNLRPGDTSSSGTIMFRIARGDLIELYAELAEADIAGVFTGDPAEVTLASGQTLKGIVRLRGARVEDRTGLAIVRLALPRAPDLRAGGFAQARFTHASPPVRAVPEAAVHFDADGASVQTLTGDNRVHRVSVRTGRRAGGMVELVSGPQPGARVVLAGGAFVLEGDRVRTEARAAK